MEKSLETRSLEYKSSILILAYKKLTIPSLFIDG
jgi:hypothetical protein